MSFSDTYFLNNKITPPPAGTLQVFSTGLQALVGVDEVGLEALKPNFELVVGSAGTLQVSETGVQALIGPSTLVRMDAFRGIAEVRKDALGSLQVSKIGLQALIAAAAVLEMRAFRKMLEVGQNALGTLQVSQAALQALIGPPAIVPIPPSAPIPPFLHIHPSNWADQVEIESTWHSSITSSPSDGTSEHINESSKPERLLKFSWVFDAREKSAEDLRIKATLLHEYLQQITSERSLMPLVCDVISVSVTVVPGNSGILSSSTLVLSSSTTILASSNASSPEASLDFEVNLRRFYPGYPIALYKTDFNGIEDPKSAFCAIIETVDTITGKITLKDAEFPDIGDGSFWTVVPLIYCEPIGRPEIEHLTNGVMVIQAEAKEVIGPLALPAFSAPQTDPLPYWAPVPHWGERVTTSYQREMQADSGPRGSSLTPLSDRYRHVQEFTARENRAGWATQIMPFWDGLRGGWRPFVLSEPSIAGKCVGIQGSIAFFLPADVTVFDSIGYTSFAERAIDCGYLSVHYFNGTTTRHRITGVENQVLAWAVFVDPPFASPLDGKLIEAAYFARVYHHELDTITERWYSPDAVEVSFRVVEDPLIGPVPLE